VTYMDGLLSGVIQGVTEFLPVSSSGHLVLLHRILGIKIPNVQFDVFLHASTLLATVIYFRKDIVRILLRDRKFLFFICIGSVPIILTALFWGSLIEVSFQNVFFVSCMLLITGVWLIIGHSAEVFLQKGMFSRKGPSIKTSFIVGVTQALSLLPGISRSGVTISTGMILGLKRETAFKFSFLLSIPAVFGACVYKLSSLDVQHAAQNLGAYFVGGFTAFVFGLVTIRVLYLVLSKRKMHYFGIYCLVIGGISLILSF